MIIEPLAKSVAAMSVPMYISIPVIGSALGAASGTGMEVEIVTRMAKYNGNKTWNKTGFEQRSNSNSLGKTSNFLFLQFLSINSIKISDYPLI